MIEYFTALRDLYSIRLFVLVNFAKYLSKEDLSMLMKQIALDELNVLFVESEVFDFDIPMILLTADLCEL
jgi:CRISPR type II-A-associated protein Csn2